MTVPSNSPTTPEIGPAEVGRADVTPGAVGHRPLQDGRRETGPGQQHAAAGLPTPWPPGCANATTLRACATPGRRRRPHGTGERGWVDQPRLQRRVGDHDRPGELRSAGGVDDRARGRRDRYPVHLDDLLRTQWCGVHAPGPPPAPGLPAPRDVHPRQRDTPHPQAQQNGGRDMADHRPRQLRDRRGDSQRPCRAAASSRRSSVNRTCAPRGWRSPSPVRRARRGLPHRCSRRRRRAEQRAGPGRSRDTGPACWPDELGWAARRRPVDNPTSLWTNAVRRPRAPPAVRGYRPDPGVGRPPGTTRPGVAWRLGRRRGTAVLRNGKRMDVQAEQPAVVGLSNGEADARRRGARATSPSPAPRAPTRGSCAPTSSRSTTRSCSSSAARCWRWAATTTR